MSGLPTTVLFGLLFIAWTQSPRDSVEATTLIPAICGVDGLFILCYIYFLRFNIKIALGFAFLLWFICSFLLLTLHIHNFFYSLGIYACLTLASYYLIATRLKIKSVSGKKTLYTPAIILIRSLVSGSIVLFTVLMSYIGGPILGGIFGVFPALLTSTLMITYFAQGETFSIAVGKSSLIAILSAVIYVIFVRYTYLSLGILFGTIFSLTICYLFAYVLYTFVIKKLK